MAHTRPDFLDSLAWRGLLNQCSDAGGLRAHLDGGTRRMYVGFDPTANSLTIGNLVGIMCLAHWQRAGHQPVALMGGGTGMIGDPSGKSAERSLLTSERVAENVGSIRRIFSNILDFSPTLSNTTLMLDNATWLGRLGYIEALRDIGKHFSVNMMMQKDSVRERLTNREQGISYTEFSYMILQAYDFAFLRENEGVSVQGGGSDQWGNIVVGIDLIAKRHRGVFGEAATPPDSFGLTWPLITKADGTKFGKTETGAVWLSPHRTSPYAYFQFWLNAADADVGKFLRVFTFLPREEIESLEAQARINPGERAAQRALARAATTILHGEAECARAEEAGKALFSGDVAGLPLATLTEIFESVPSSPMTRDALGAGVALLDVLVTTKLAASKREAKDFLTAGSVTVNGRKAGAEETLTTNDLLHGSLIAIRRGKKQWHVLRCDS